MSRTGKLTDKQSRFIDEYLIDLNATQAAIRAGYSEKTAQEIGAQNLSKLIISEEIQKRMQKRSESTEITAERVLKEYAKIAFTNLPGIVNFNKGMMSIEDFQNLNEDQKACIKKFKCKTVVSMTESGDEVPVEMVEVELHDKQNALGMIGKHLGMFTEKVEHSGVVETKQTVAAYKDHGDTEDWEKKARENQRRLMKDS